MRSVTESGLRGAVRKRERGDDAVERVRGGGWSVLGRRADLRETPSAGYKAGLIVESPVLSVVGTLAFNAVARGWPTSLTVGTVGVGARTKR